MFKVKSFLNTALIYAIGHLLTKLQTFILLPILTHYLGAYDYGVVESLNAFAYLITVLVLFNLDSSISSFFYKYQGVELKYLFSSALAIQLMISFFVLISLFVTNGWLLNLLALRPEHRNILFISILASVFSAYMQINLSWLRYQQKAFAFSLVSFIQTLVYFVGCIYSVNVANEKILGIFISQLASIILASTILSIINRNFLVAHFPQKNIIEHFKIAIPLLPFSFANWFLSLFDRIFISHTLGLAQTGIYGAANRFSTMGSLLFSPFMLSWQPKALQHLTNKTETEFFNKSAKWLIVVASIFIVATSYFSETLMRLVVPSDFIDGSRWVPLLMLCNLFNIFYYFSLARFLHHKRSILSTYTLVFGATTNVILNFILTPKLGIAGCIIANLLGYSMIMVLSWIMAQKLHFIKAELKKFILTFFILTIVALIPVFFKSQNILLLFLLFLLNSFLLMCYFTVIDFLDFKELISKLKR